MLPKRLFPDLIKEVCASNNIDFKDFSDDWMLRLSRGPETHFTVGYGFDINNASGDRIGNDKVAQFILLEDAKIPAIEHHLAKSRTHNKILKSVFSLPENSPYVLKPIEGSGGLGMSLVSNLRKAIDAIESSDDDSEWVISPWYDINNEKRIIILDNEILAAYDKTKPALIDGLKMFNLGQGAIAVNFTPNENERVMAIKAARACSLRLCSVDIATLESGEQRIMEINSGIMMENYARMSDKHYAKALEVYNKIVRATFDLL